MQNKIKKYLKEIFLTVLILFISINLISYYRSLDLNKEKLDIKKFKLIDNRTYNIKDNKPLLIHFWATWCPICKFEAKNIEKISKKYQVITIAVQSGNKKDINEYLKKHNLSFLVVNDKDAFYMNKFNIKVFPTTLIYDRTKNLKFSEVGYTSTLGLLARLEIIK